MKVTRKIVFVLLLFLFFAYDVKALESDSVSIFNDESVALENEKEKTNDEINKKLEEEKTINNETNDLGNNLENEVSGKESNDLLNDEIKNETDDIFVNNDEPVDNNLELDDISNDGKIKMLKMSQHGEENEISVEYGVHVQGIGWQEEKKDGEMAGTTGESKRLEAIQITLENGNYFGNIEYRVHVQSIGWQDYKKDGEVAGTTGESKRLEAIQIRLTGKLVDYYDIYYRVHVEKFGWLGWAKNDEMAGTSGYKYRMEALEIKLLRKNEPFYDENVSYYQHVINYQAHVQGIGWQEEKKDGEMAGTAGESKRLEAIKIYLEKFGYTGNIEYRVHVQSIGWQDYKRNGEVAGTTGESKRIEAIQIRLTGQLAEHYDIYYRANVQNYSWLGWAKNDEMAGTSGYGYRLEAIEIQLLSKDKIIDTSIPAYKQDYIRYNSYVNGNGWQGFVADGNLSGTVGQKLGIEGLQIYLVNPIYSGTVMYKSYINGYGWENDYRTNGQTSGTNNSNKNIEAVKILLIGEISKQYDIYYRVHCQKEGWLDWAKNGEFAGTIGFNYRLEGIEIKLVKLGDTTPESNGESFIFGDIGYSLISSALNNNKVVEVYRASVKDSSNVSLYDRNDSVAQLWNIKRLNDGYYLISSSINPNVYLTADNQNVVVQRYSGYDNQLWSITNASNGLFYISSKSNKLYITIENGNTQNKTNVILQNLLGNNSQLFSFINYNDTIIYNGLDVSSHQGYIDWERVSNNINFAIIRLGYGNNESSQDDTTFLYNISKCEEYNIPYGVYIYSYALNESDARSEAEHTLRLLENTGDNFLLGVWFDMEDADNYKLRHGMPSNEQLVNICDTFGNMVENHGYKVGIYASLSWLNNQLNSPKLNRYDKWVAHWNGPVTFTDARTKPTSYGGIYSLWQFCSDGQIDGVSGYLDLDLGYNLF